MTGACYIDGVDIYAEFGVIITEGGYNELLTFPAMKEPDKNDWAEYNGVEVDLSAPALAPLEVSITFARITGYAWNNFVYSLAVPGYRTINIPALGRALEMRLAEMPALQTYADASLLTLKFVRDEVGIPTYQTPNGNAAVVSDIAIDGYTLDRFGVFLTGGYEELTVMPKIKKSLTRSFALKNGQTYDIDNENIKYDAKDVTFKCCLNASQMVFFWQLYDAFFGALTQPGVRQIAYQGKVHEAYYKKSSNFRLHSHRGEVICEFDLTMCFTAFRMGGELYLLAAENNYMITTENGIFIDLEH